MTQVRSWGFLAVSLASTILATASARIDLPSGDEVARSIEAQPDSTTCVRNLQIDLLEANGSVRHRTARLLRKRTGDTTSTLFVFDSPANIAGTALLIADHDDPSKDDERWLYLPAMRKSRRIAAGERGEMFFGTDLTYDEIRNESRLSTREYLLTTLAQNEIHGRACVSVEARPREARVAEELGYTRLVACMDAAAWIPLQLLMYDPGDRLVKTITLTDLRLANGYWTAFRHEARNEQTGHATVVTTTSVNHDVELPDTLFLESSLPRGGR